MNYGYQNEYDFVELFNNKFLYELDSNSQNFIKDLFGETIDNSEVIKCWKNKIELNYKDIVMQKFTNYNSNISILLFFNMI